MLSQGVLDFRYDAERSSHGQTGLAGLPVFLDLIQQSGLAGAIRRFVCVSGLQGWLDLQMVLAVLFLNLAGGDCVEDLERLEADNGGDPEGGGTGAFDAAGASFVAGAVATAPRAGGAVAVGDVGMAGAVPRPGGCEGGGGQRAHSGGDGGCAGSVAGQPGAGGLCSGERALDDGDAGHGRDPY